jgi:hypothetical protein
LKTAKVKANNTYTMEFRVESGVKHGDLVSPTLFSLVIDTVLKKLDLKCNISTRLRQLTAYADDILIIARTKQSLIETFQQLKNNSMEVGLIINEKKTISKMHKKRYQNREFKYQNGLHIEQVQEYIYLGSIINDSNL